MQDNNAFTNQVAAELAFAKAMGWEDWTPAEESEPGMVRGFHVQWSPDPKAGLIVPDEGDEDARYVLVTGEPPTMTVNGWTTVGEAKVRTPDW
jgi:hypothetical protein